MEKKLLNLKKYLWKVKKRLLFNKEQLDLVFVKHYAPNICLIPNMAEFAVS